MDDGELRDDLIRLSERLSAVAARADETSFSEPLVQLMNSAEAAAEAWSGSSLGYHALVYYARLERPPPGAHFSQEWGLSGVFQGTTGDWREYPHDDVIAAIQAAAGNPDLARVRRDAREARELVEDAKDDVTSMLRARLARQDDGYLQTALEAVLATSIFSYDECVRAQLPSGQFMTRDRVAIGAGIRSAPHQEVIADILSLRAPFDAAGRLATQCRRAARHLVRIATRADPNGRARSADRRIVIGHGQSPLWRELKEFIADRLSLPWDEFNRVSVAGVATTDRLQQMVESAGMAFLVATAEDEAADGRLMARQNVIHEIGLFQGRLGFGRAIVLLEEGCEEFSNIHGLGQIRFPRGNIAAQFDLVRGALEREGFL